MISKLAMLGKLLDDTSDSLKYCIECVDKGVYA